LAFFFSLLTFTEAEVADLSFEMGEERSRRLAVDDEADEEREGVDEAVDDDDDEDDDRFE
jgi:hypothetical protein